MPQKQQLVLLYDGTGCSLSANTNVAVLNKALGFGLDAINIPSVDAGTQINKYQLSEQTTRLVIYQEGLGAPALTSVAADASASYCSPKKIINGLASAFNGIPEAAEQLEAFGIIDNIMHAYKFLVKNYQPGDQVFCFGFSRGAYTLRLLLTIIKDIGLLDASKYSALGEIDRAIDDIFSIYRQKINLADNPEIKKFKDKCHPSEKLIHFVGLFESVSGPIAEEVHKDARLGNVVNVFRHFVAADEHRLEFSVELVIPEEGADFAQEWCPGSHGDIGGGYKDTERGLANQTLHSMVEQANLHGLNLNLESIAQYKADPLGELHDSRAEEIVEGVSWAQVTVNCRRPICTKTKETLSKALLARYGENVTNDASKKKSIYAPSNVNKALANTINTLNAFQLFENGAPAVASLPNKIFEFTKFADEWSDADEDEAKDTDRPVEPSLIPPKPNKRRQKVN
jgi:uncharacterized protein (DUF2235 family)